MALFSGSTDKLADPKDVQLLIKALVNVPKDKFFWKEFDAGHLTFMWGNENAMNYFNDVLKILSE